MSNENVSLAPAASPDKNKKMLRGLLKMPAFLPFVGLVLLFSCMAIFNKPWSIFLFLSGDAASANDTFSLLI